MLLLGASLALSFSNEASAQDWPRFRGPNGSGHAAAAALPDTWTEKDYTWKVKLPGPGHSSPVLFGGKCFITFADKPTARRGVCCIDVKGGTILWTKDFEFSPFAVHNFNSFAHSTPAVDELHVYTAWISPQSYELVAHTHTGEQAWRAGLGRYVSQHGNGSSPIVFEDLVILANDQDGPDACIAAFDRKTGEPRWKVPRKTGGKASSSTPCIYQPEGSAPQLIVTSKPEGMSAYDPRSGAPLWNVPGAFPMRTVASPVVAQTPTGNLIIANCGDGEGPRMRRLVAVRPATKAEIAWTAGPEVTSLPYVPTPIVAGERLITWSEQGQVSCFAVATGKLLWSERIEGAYFSSPILIDSKLYSITRKGEAIVLDITDKPKVISRIPLDEPCFTTPAVAGGRLYIRTATHLLSLGK
jgi:outer membrane protein assembly factor BamB